MEDRIEGLLPFRQDFVVAVDTETSGLFCDDGARVTTVSVAWHLMNDPSLGIVSHAFPFDHGAKPGMQGGLFEDVENMGEAEWLTLMKWLKKQRLVMHKAYFDCPMIHTGPRWGGGRLGVDLVDHVVWDTKIAAQVLDPHEDTSLKPTCERLWGEDSSEEQRTLAPYLARTKPKNRFDLVPWSVLKPYAAKDAELTLRLAHYQWGLLEEGFEHLKEHIRIEMEALPVFVRMNYRGIGYDIDGSSRAAADAAKVLKEIDEALPFVPHTPKGAQHWFFAVQGAVPHCLTKIGQKPSVGECCTRSLVEQQVPGAEEWAEHQKVGHAISTWYEGYVAACGTDGRLRTDMDQLGTITGRAASRRVNLQAIPHDYQLQMLIDRGIPSVRSFFHAKPGSELWEFDLSQAEARVAARLAGCTKWLAMFAQGRDLHQETADRLKLNRGPKENRQIAKRANFSLIYLVGPVTLRKMIEKWTGILLGEEESVEIVRGWRKLYPEFVAVNKRTEREAVQNGYIQLVDGRLRHFRPWEELHKAFNAKVQGSIAQFMKMWMPVMDRTPGVETVLQIHDSLVVEIEEGDDFEDGTMTGSQLMAELIKAEGAELATRFFDIEMKVDGGRWGMK